MNRPLTDQERKELVILFENILNFERYAEIAISELAAKDPRLRETVDRCKMHFAQSESVFTDLRKKLLS